MRPRAKQLGVTDDEYFAMLARQGGECAIKGCKRKPKTRRFHVDHDHATGQVRGLLCHWHNRILPKTSMEARAMAAYLDHFSTRGDKTVDGVYGEVVPTLTQMHREAAKVTPRRKDPAW